MNRAEVVLLLAEVEEQLKGISDLNREARLTVGHKVWPVIARVVPHIAVEDEGTAKPLVQVMATLIKAGVGMQSGFVESRTALSAAYHHVRFWCPPAVLINLRKF